jgi:hypothetical protein
VGYLLSGAAGSINIALSNLVNPASILYVNASVLQPQLSPSAPPPSTAPVRMAKALPPLDPSASPEPEFSIMAAVEAAPKVGGGQSFGSNTDTYLMYSQESALQQWNITDYAAAGMSGLSITFIALCGGGQFVHANFRAHSSWNCMQVIPQMSAPLAIMYRRQERSRWARCCRWASSRAWGPVQ